MWRLNWRRFWRNNTSSCRGSRAFPSAWLLLLHCASPRANYLLRVLPPGRVLRFAQVHDDRLWQCFCGLLRIAANSSTLPMSLGSLGLRRALCTSAPAYWASWADTLPMIPQRHPVVVEDMVSWLNRQTDVPCLRAAAAVADQLTGVSGFSPPSWEALVAGVRPPPHEPDDNEPGCSRFEKAMLRSQGGCGAGVALSTSPTCALTRIEPPFFRTLLLRRLRLPLSLTQSDCPCGRPLDSRGHHRAACSRSGVLGRRGICSGECCCPRVSRGWSARHNKHPGSRYGCCPPEPFRHETFGDGRGRAPPVQRAAAGLGHHARVEFALRRVASAWSSKQRWGSVGRSTPTEEPHVS